jgi:lysyl-tRNA synthetase class 2
MAEGFLNLPWRRGPVTEHPDPAASSARRPLRRRADLEAAGTAPPEQVRVRHEKLVRLRAAGRDPHPAGFDRTATCGAVTARFDGLPADTHTGERVAVAGRVVLSRHHGRLCFATLSDWSGDVPGHDHRAGGRGGLEGARRSRRPRRRRRRGGHLPARRG